jgi:hypothetical protein
MTSHANDPDQDGEISQAVRRWLWDEPTFIPERRARIAEALERVERTPQRHRWWPLVPFGRRAKRSASATDRVIGGPDVTRRERGPHDRRRSLTMLSPVRIIATIAILAIGVGTLTYAMRPAGTGLGAPGAEVPAVTAESLSELVLKAWNTMDRTAFEEAYAPDAVHSIIYYDTVVRFEGLEAIYDLAWVDHPEIKALAPPIELPAEPGELRWAWAVRLANGIVCVMKAVDGKVVRHDCVVDGTSY